MECFGVHHRLGEKATPSTYLEDEATMMQASPASATTPGPLELHAPRAHSQPDLKRPKEEQEKE